MHGCFRIKVGLGECRIETVVGTSPDAVPVGGTRTACRRDRQGCGCWCPAGGIGTGGAGGRRGRAEGHHGSRKLPRRRWRRLARLAVRHIVDKALGKADHRR